MWPHCFSSIASCSFACCLIVSKRQNVKSKHEPGKLVIPTRLNFWSIWCEVSVPSRQRQALGKLFSRALPGQNDSFSPEYYRKLLNRKRTSSHDEICFKYEQLFLQVQCTAWKKCQSTSIEILFLRKASGILSPSYQFQCLWCTNCFANSIKHIQEH